MKSVQRKIFPANVKYDENDIPQRFIDYTWDEIVPYVAVYINAVRYFVDREDLYEKS